MHVWVWLHGSEPWEAVAEGRVSHTLNWKGWERITAVWCPQGDSASSLGDLWWGYAPCMKPSLGRNLLSSPSSYPEYWVATRWLKVFFRGNKNQTWKERAPAFAVFLTIMESLGLDWREHKEKFAFISSIQSWIASNRESCISPFPLPIPVCCLWKYQFESKWELKSSIFMGEKETCFSHECFY